jgi:signal transduction histidine kinase
MRSFWIRIFATFWLIEILTVSGVFILRGRLEDFRGNPLSEKAVRLMAFSAEEAYQAGQCPGLGAIFHRFEQVYKVTPYLFDKSGRVVCRSSVSPAVEEAVNSTLSSGLLHAIVRYRTQDQDGAMLAAIHVDPRQNGPYTFVAKTLQKPSVLYRFRVQLAILTAVLLSGIITALLARILVRPIGQLRHTALELASGNLRARAKHVRNQTTKGDEVAALARDFNRMADRIETLISTQKQLIRDVSHELRSPLCRLSVASELLRQNTNEQSMVHVERILRETERLNRLIGQMQELSRMEALDGVGVSKQMVRLEDIVNGVVENASYEARSRNCNVRAVSVEEASAYANAELLSSAMENVVRNAIRYTNCGTDVIVMLERQQDEAGSAATVTIRDFGPGVPEDKIPSLCMPFYRVDPARSNESGGMGVGLAIADRAVRLHGGSLTLRNHPQGGLEVTIRIPISKPILSEMTHAAAVSAT